MRKARKHKPQQASLTGERPARQKPEPAPVPPPLIKEQLDRMVEEHRKLIHPGMTDEEFHDAYYGSGGGAR